MTLNSFLVKFDHIFVPEMGAEQSFCRTARTTMNLDHDLEERQQVVSYDKYMLKKRRQKLGLTQQEVADRAAIQIKQYQRFEGGDRELAEANFMTVYKVIRALEMDVEKYAAGEYEIKELIYSGYDDRLYNYETDEPISE